MAIGEQSVKAAFMLIIGVMIAIAVGAAVLPQAVSDWFNASTSNWGNLASSMWVLVPGFGVLAIGLFFIGMAFDII